MRAQQSSQVFPPFHEIDSLIDPIDAPFSSLLVLQDKFYLSPILICIFIDIFFMVSGCWTD